MKSSRLYLSREPVFKLIIDFLPGSTTSRRQMARSGAIVPGEGQSFPARALPNIKSLRA